MASEVLGCRSSTWALHGPLSVTQVTMNSIVAIVVGAAIAIASYWIGAVVALLAMHGIPLGSPGGKATGGDILAHFLIATVATVVGVNAAIRIDRARVRPNSLALGLLLASLSAIAFSKESSSWPRWFPIVMVLACIGGALIATRITRIS